MLVNYLKAMAVFSAVVEAGSFTKAGEALQMPRGKVSEQVARLETYLGVKLLQRSTRKVSVTDEGYALYQEVQRLLPSAVRGVNEVKSFHAEIKGTIRLTTTQDHYEALLLPVLKQFSQQYPKVSFDLKISEQPLPIIEDSIDLAIRSGEQPDSNLVSVPLAMTRLKLYASPELTRVPQTPEELPQFPWISLSGKQASAAIALQNDVGDVVQVLPNCQHQANNIASYQPLLLQGFGIGVLAEATATVLQQQNRLVAVLPDWHVQQLQLSLVYPARQYMAQRTRLLIDFIRQHLGD